MVTVHGVHGGRPWFAQDDDGEPAVYDNLDDAQEAWRERLLGIHSETVVFFDLETYEYEIW